MRPGASRPSARPKLDPPEDLEAFEVDDSLVLLTWSPRRASPQRNLTDAEGAVLDLVRAGHSNAEIAARRGRSKKTVAHQVQSIFAKLGVTSRAELFARCARHDGEDIR